MGFIKLVAALVVGGTSALLNGPSTFFEFESKSIDEKPVKLSKFEGKVVMVVNVASKCGNTPQYAQLQELYTKYSSSGFVVIGFPANNFRSQEPGTNKEISEFCTKEYGVTFPMMSKISVKGEDQAPIYKWLVENSDRPKDDVEWNFAKFLVDRKGMVRYRFAPSVKPDDESVVAAINELVAEKR